MKILGLVPQSDGVIVELNREECSAIQALIDSFGENPEWLRRDMLLPPDHPIDHWLVAVRIFVSTRNDVIKARQNLEEILLQMDNKR